MDHRSKSSTFRLQTLFEVRERSKKSAQEALSLAQQQVRREQGELDQLENDLSRKTKERDLKRTQYADEIHRRGSTIQTIRIQELHVSALKAREEETKAAIQKQKDVVERTKQLEKEKLVTMLTRNRELKTVEKLKEKWVLDLRKHQEQKDDDTRDEISQAQFVNQRIRE
jgi:flagellar biosynthesis chaperone FliJ